MYSNIFTHSTILDDIQMPHGIDVYIKIMTAMTMWKSYTIPVDLNQFAFIVASIYQMKSRMKIATHTHNATSVRIKIK